MIDSELISSLEGGLLILTLNRPDQRNALSPSLGVCLAKTIRGAAEDPSVRAVLLRGGSYFCVGGDVAGMMSKERQTMDRAQRVESLSDRTEAARLLHEMPKPTVAAVAGPAAGAGLALALACDFRFVAAEATFSTAFARIGTSGDYGCAYFLTRAVGPAKARELMFLATRFDGQQAFDMGMATRVLPKNEVDNAARDFAKALAEGPTLAYASIKRNLDASLAGGLQCYLRGEAGRHIDLLSTEDHNEGVSAFREHRIPRFMGR